MKNKLGPLSCKLQIMSVYYKYIPLSDPVEDQAELNEKINHIVKLLKEDYRHRMSIQMTPWIQGHKVKMEELYTRLIIEKHTFKPKGKHKEQLVEYQKLFEDDDRNFSSKRILVKGNPGIGKTTFSKKVTFDWAQDITKFFLFTFFITLKYVGPNDELEDMIIKQNPSLKDSSIITRRDIKSILQHYGSRCLVILDGFDEVADLHFKHVEEIVQNQSYRNCNIIVTSRPNVVNMIEAHVYTKASIEGFTKEKAKEYIGKVIEDESKQNAVYEYTQNNEIEDMWKYPILVLFVCLLVNWDEIDLIHESLSLGELYTRLLNCLFRRYIEERKKKGNPEKDKQPSEDEERERREILLKLGELAFNGLLSSKIAYRRKDVIQRVGEDAFEYGILIGSEEYDDKTFLHENADIFVFFQHKSIQEYLAAKYFMHKISSGEKSITDMIGKRRKLGFVKDNLMFFTFCAYFLEADTVKMYSDSDEKFPIKGKGGNANPARFELVHYMEKCFNKEKLSLKGLAMSHGCCTLLLESLSQCNKISQLHLECITLTLPFSTLLKGLAPTIQNLTLENCSMVKPPSNTEDVLTLENLKTIICKKLHSIHTIASLLNNRFPVLQSIIIDACFTHPEDNSIFDNSMSSCSLPTLQDFEIVFSNISSNGGALLIQKLLQNAPNIKCFKYMDFDRDGYIRRPEFWNKLMKYTLKTLKVFPHSCGRHCNVTSRQSQCNVLHEWGFTIKQIPRDYRSSYHTDPVIHDSPKAWVLVVEYGKVQEELCGNDNKPVYSIDDAMFQSNRGSSDPISISSFITNVMDGIYPMLENIEISYFGKLHFIHEKNENYSGQYDLQDGYGVLGKSSVPSLDQCYHNLRCVDLSENTEGSDFVKLLVFHKLKALEILCLTQCNLDEESCIAIGRANDEQNLSYLKALQLGGNSNLSGKVGFLLKSAWPTLRTLNLEQCNITLHDIKALCEAVQKEMLPSLQELQGLAGNRNLSGQVDALLCRTIRKLDLQECNLTADDIRALNEANSKGFLPCLQELQLSKNLNIQGMCEILLSNPWMVMQQLNLFQCNLNENDTNQIHSARMKGILPSLDLTVECSLPGHVPVVPVMCGAWASEEVLDLSKCDKQDLTTIAEANRYGQLPSVKRINLQHNRNISGQVGALLCSTWSALEDLDLVSSDLTCRDVEALDQANQLHHLPCLKKLNLYWCKKLSGQGLTALLSHTWSTLKEVNLRYCSLTSADGDTLLEACRQGRLPQLSKLDIGGNDGISGAGLSSLLSHTWSTLQELNLWYCSLTAADCDTLLEACRQGRLPQLSKLDIGGNDGISGAGLSSLLSHTWSTLQELNLWYCSLTAADCDTLLEACRQGRLPQLNKLNISRNDGISGAGLSSLLSHTWSTLQELVLWDCSLTAADGNTLLEACRHERLPQLSKLDIRLRFPLT